MCTLVYDKVLLKCVCIGSSRHFTPLFSLRRDFVLTKSGVKQREEIIGFEANLSLSLFVFPIFFHS